MSTDLAQSPKWDEDRTKVDLGHPRAAYPHPSDLNFVEAAKSDGPVGRYLPGKWSWGPAKGRSSLGLESQLFIGGNTDIGSASSRSSR